MLAEAVGVVVVYLALFLFLIIFFLYLEGVWGLVFAPFLFFFFPFLFFSFLFFFFFFFEGVVFCAMRCVILRVAFFPPVVSRCRCHYRYFVFGLKKKKYTSGPP